MPDLTFARATVQKLMEAACTVIRVPQDSAMVDVVTLDLVPDPSAVTTIYSGKCVVTPTSAGGFTVRLPYDAPEVKTRDLVTVSASTDPLLAGSVLEVTEVVRTSYLVWRTLLCERFPRG